jgi:AraC family transcriptional regulator
LLLCGVDGDGSSSPFVEKLLNAQVFSTRYEDGLPKYKLKQALEYMNVHLNENVSLATISDELSISQYYFCRLFKQSTGMTPHAYLIQQRVERAKQLLKRKEGTMLDIAIECGFANPSHFAKHFRKHTGISPKQFRML